MTQKIVIPNCTVEITLPLFDGVCVDLSKIKLRAREYVDGVRVRLDDKVLIVNKLYIESLVGHMAASLNERGEVIYFTVEENPHPDLVVKADGTPSEPPPR